MYSARLRLHGELNRPKTRVSKLLKELGLKHVANVRIGGESSSGISGGGKRRASIGVHLAHDPAVLLIDEPTSALDSSSAINVASLLKHMATKQGKTIVLTIHQPGFRILELFDQILLLSNGTVLHRVSLHLLEHQLRYAGHSIPRNVNVLEFAIEMTEAIVVDTEDSEFEDTDTHKEREFGNTRKNPVPVNVEETRTCYSNPPFEEVIKLVRDSPVIFAGQNNCLLQEYYYLYLLVF